MTWALSNSFKDEIFLFFHFFLLILVILDRLTHLSLKRIINMGLAKERSSYNANKNESVNPY